MHLMASSSAGLFRAPPEPLAMTMPDQVNSNAPIRELKKSAFSKGEALTVQPAAFNRSTISVFVGVCLHDIGYRQVKVILVFDLTVP